MIRWIHLALACAIFCSAPMIGSASAEEAWEKEWSATVARAKGQPLALIVHSQSGYPELVDEFKKEFPGIDVQMTVLAAAPAASRIATEQKNGMYAWDVWWAPVGNMVSRLVPIGALAPITDYFILPEVANESNWNAPEYLYPEGTKPFVFVHTYQQDTNIYQNLSVPGTKPITKVEDLLNPALKGEVGMRDAVGLNSSTLSLAGLMRENGADFVKHLLAATQPVIIDNQRQLTDTVIRGEKTVVIGADNGVYAECVNQGGCKDVKQLGYGVYVTSRGLSVMKNAPHKDSAKVWVNWLLSKKGQEAFVKTYARFWNTGASSMRKDVAPAPKHENSVPDYANLGRLTLTVDASGNDITKEVIKIFETYKNKQ